MAIPLTILKRYSYPMDGTFHSLKETDKARFYYYFRTSESI